MAAVIEESSPRDDERVFTLKGEGGWRYIVRVPLSECSDADIGVLWRLLQWKERRPRQLKIIS